jgi:hypothetical protein
MRPNAKKKWNQFSAASAAGIPHGNPIPLDGKRVKGVTDSRLTDFSVAEDVRKRTLRSAEDMQASPKPISYKFNT